MRGALSELLDYDADRAVLEMEFDITICEAKQIGNNGRPLSKKNFDKKYEVRSVRNVSWIIEVTSHYNVKHS
jgi:hypothetical protein